MADKAGKSYWDQVWTNRDLPSAVNPRSRTLSNYADYCLHRYFSTVLSDLGGVRTHLLEIGCARSTWLPYFGKEYGFSITGLDYSEIGCQQARQILANEHI